VDCCLGEQKKNFYLSKKKHSAAKKKKKKITCRAESVELHVTDD